MHEDHQLEVRIRHEPKSARLTTSPRMLTTSSTRGLDLPPSRQQTDYSLFLFLFPRDGGHNYWLVGAWDEILPPCPDRHMELFERSNEAGTVHYLGREKAIHEIRSGYVIRMTHRISTPSMKKIEEIVGPFESEGLWMFGRLQPRRTPGALRFFTTNPTTLQLWTSL